MQPLTSRVKRLFLTSFRKKRLIFACKLRCDVPFWRLQECPQLPMTAARNQLHPTISKTRNRFVLNRARGFESHHLSRKKAPAQAGAFLHIQPDFSILQKICINNFCSESSQAYRQDELSLHCAYTFSLNTTSSGSAQSAVSGGWNVNDTQKTASAFENGDGLFVGKQFLCSSLQLAQVAVDGGFRGA